MTTPYTWRNSDTALSLFDDFFSIINLSVSNDHHMGNYFIPSLSRGEY